MTLSTCYIGPATLTYTSPVPPRSAIHITKASRSRHRSRKRASNYDQTQGKHLATKQNMENLDMTLPVMENSQDTMPYADDMLPVTPLQKALILFFLYYGYDFDTYKRRGFSLDLLAKAISKVLERRDGIAINPDHIVQYYNQVMVIVAGTSERRLFHKDERPPEEWHYGNIGKFMYYQVEKEDDMDEIVSLKLDDHVVRLIFLLLKITR